MRLLDKCFSVRDLTFSPRLIPVSFVMDEMALEPDISPNFFGFIRNNLHSIIASYSPTPTACDYSDQAAQYHILVLQMSRHV